LEAKEAELQARVDVAKQAVQRCKKGMMRQGEDSPAPAIGRTVIKVSRAASATVVTGN
jgi:hypothetical protein